MMTRLTNIGWHASPSKITRKEGWIHVLSGLRSMSRHLSVDFTKPSILRNLQTSFRFDSDMD